MRTTDKLESVEISRTQSATSRFVDSEEAGSIALFNANQPRRLARIIDVIGYPRRDLVPRRDSPWPCRGWDLDDLAVYGCPSFALDLARSSNLVEKRVTRIPTLPPRSMSSRYSLRARISSKSAGTTYGVTTFTTTMMTRRLASCPVPSRPRRLAPIPCKRDDALDVGVVRRQCY